MKVVFAGTPEIAVPSLEKIARRHEVVGVLTNPDRVRGRGRAPSFSPVKAKAVELGLPVFQFPSLKREAREAIARLEPDILAVFAFGRIFGPKFLSIFPLGGINVHPSLLPAYRGSIPIAAALINGDTYTGITIQYLAQDLDTGDILLQERISLDQRMNTEELSGIAAHRGADLLSEALNQLQEKTVQARPQDPLYASYCRKLHKQDGLIHWPLPASMIERMIRAYYPWPKAYTFWNGIQLSILKAKLLGPEQEASISNQEQGKKAPGQVLGIDRKNGILIQTGKGLLCAEELQLQGKKRMSWDAFINGNKSIIGSQLGEKE